MTAIAVIAALNLPAAARVDQRVPKKLLLENGASTAADKRLINEGIDGIQWLAALKPVTCGIPEFRDEAREYLEIAVLRMALREKAKEARLVELLHRAVGRVEVVDDDAVAHEPRDRAVHKHHWRFLPA